MPPAPPEYCLFWIDHFATCMSKAEWSGWAQAIGSILALAIAIAIPAKARWDARRDAKEIFLTFMGMVVGALDDVTRACKSRQWDSFVAARQLVRDIAHSGEFLLNSSVNVHIRSMALTVRARALEACNLSADHSPMGNWPHWHAHFASFADATRAMRESAKAAKP